MTDHARSVQEWQTYTADDVRSEWNRLAEASARIVSERDLARVVLAIGAEPLEPIPAELVAAPCEILNARRDAASPSIDGIAWVCAACRGSNVQTAVLLNPNSPSELDADAWDWRPGKCIESSTWCYDCDLNGLGVLPASEVV